MADAEFDEEDLDDLDFDDDGEMPWEGQTRTTIERVLEKVTFDEIRGVIDLFIACTLRPQRAASTDPSSPRGKFFDSRNYLRFTL